MNLLPEAQTALGLIISGVFYDQIKTVATLSYSQAKETLAKHIPFKKEELDIIEAEIISYDLNTNREKAKFEEYINNNETIQQILLILQKREEKKVSEIINSFKNNTSTIFDLTLGEKPKVEDSFNDNKNCEIVIR